MRILLIAADGTLRATLVVALRHAGHEALVTKASAMARGRAEGLDEVLIIAGEFAGCLELLERVREGKYKAPAVVISGPHDFHDGERLRRCRGLWISDVNFDPSEFATLVGKPEFPLMREGSTTLMRQPRKRSGVQKLAQVGGVGLEQRLDRAGDSWQREYRLTSMERAVLVSAAKGGTRETIAVEMHICPETVKTHIKNLLAKTGDAALALAGARLLRDLLGDSLPRERRR